MATAFFRKKILLTFIYVVTALSLADAQNPQAQFDRANEQLESGNYSDALARYHNMVYQNNISGALFLNMGIAYHRVDSLGKAKYYLLKSSRFEETNQRARQALEFVESQFSRQSAMLPQYPWNAATDWLRHNIGASNILIAGIILLNMGMLIFISHWFFNWYPKFLRISGLTILVCSLLIMVASFYTDYVNDRYSKAVMVSEKVPVLEQPQKKSSLVSQAFEGYTFTIDHHQSESQAGWAYVRMSNGLYGWIPNSEILIL